MRVPRLFPMLPLFVLPVFSAFGHTVSVNTNFPAPFNSEADKSANPPTAAEAAAGFKLPDGFKISVFASEPEVQNPIAMTWDARGRLWIAENYTYAERATKFERGLRDRVVILEDTDGDGRQDRRTVFTDEVQMLTSVEVGLGGVWLMCPPQLLFIPDRDGNDAPDSPATVALDGFTVPAENYHNFANGLRWGPDGWLYGRCGASSPGEIGAPGTPEADRVPIRGGMWRYHPVRKTFEALSHGTTNPWGHDWNDVGELFFINTVNGHLWHVLPGMHFVRPHTIDPNPHAYRLIDQHADHWHFDTGRGWANSRDGKADSFGGGHAHIGMMIYQGDNWPASYRGKLLTLNMHGRRANVERLERRGSGYIGRHEPDILFAGDPWFRGMEISSGPDGGVYLLDWSDTGECHDSTGVHRTSGRVYKVTNGSPNRRRYGDPAGLAPEEFLLLQLKDPNAWYARQAQQALHSLALSGRDLSAARKTLQRLLEDETTTAIKLRYLWALNAVNGADETFLRRLLRHRDEHVRAWAIRLLTDAWPLDTVFGPGKGSAAARINPADDLVQALTSLARRDDSALVRLTLASTLQRLPVASRPALGSALLSRVEDAQDHNLPLLIWYGLMPVANEQPEALVDVARRCRIPLTLQLIARRLAEENEKNPAAMNSLVSVAARESIPFKRAVLEGMVEGFTGWRKATRPDAWGALMATIERGADSQLKERARELSVLFGDGRAMDEVKRIALDGKADLAARRAALQSLIDSRAPEARQVCEQLLSVRFLNTTAARGLAAYDDPAIGDKLAKSYRSFHPSERPAIMETLVSRPGFARALLSEMAAGRIGRGELSAFHARQIRGFGDDALARQLIAAWGEIRDSEPEKRAMIGRLKSTLTPAVLSQAEKGHGRMLFNAACASCHRLYGVGGEAGPDLTGAGRDNLDYLLENIIDPSSVVSADFKMTIVGLKDGRFINGVVTSQNARTMTLKTMTGDVTMERSEIEETQPSQLSLMPEGLLDALTEKDIRDLIGYLMHPSQVPLPAGAPVGP